MPTPSIVSSFQWDDRYSVQVAAIDAQHQKIFSDINKLASCLEAKPELAVIEAIVDDMIDYVGYHFSTEEKLLAAHPDFSAHQARHRVFTDKTREFDRQLFATKPAEMALSLFLFLGAWLQNHILTEDRLYFDYLRANNLLPALG